MTLGSSLNAHYTSQWRRDLDLVIMCIFWLFFRKWLELIFVRNVQPWHKPDLPLQATLWIGSVEILRMRDEPGVVDKRVQFYIHLHHLFATIRNIFLITLFRLAKVHQNSRFSCKNHANRKIPVFHQYSHYLCPDFAPSEIHAVFWSIFRFEKPFFRGSIADKYLHQSTYRNG